MPKNRCFACGEANPEGLQLKFKYNADKPSVDTLVRIALRYQGATGFAHGGIIATLLDEAMAKVNGMGGTRAVTVRISVSFKKMVPLKQPLKLTGWRTAERGRKVYLRSELRDQTDALLAEARGLFLTV